MHYKLAPIVLLTAIAALIACTETKINMPPPITSHQQPTPEFKIGSPVFMRIFKEENALEVWMKTGPRYELYKTFRICKYSGGLGPKLRQGDRQSPEGFYRVSASALNPNSNYHLSFNLGFPNQYDRAHGRTGSYLMVHGSCVSAGCFAMTDERIEEIYGLAEAALNNGQDYFQVHSFPFRMTDENMRKYKFSEWYGFWENLKLGYDKFERERIPPKVLVSNKRYVFLRPIEASLPRISAEETPTDNGESG